MGAAGDADHQLDGATGRLDTQFEMKKRPPTETASLISTERLISVAPHDIYGLRLELFTRCDNLRTSMYIVPGNIIDAGVTDIV
jgi:hypothetical protein